VNGVPNAALTEILRQTGELDRILDGRGLTFEPAARTRPRTAKADPDSAARLGLGRGLIREAPPQKKAAHLQPSSFAQTRTASITIRATSPSVTPHRPYPACRSVSASRRRRLGYSTQENIPVWHETDCRDDEVSKLDPKCEAAARNSSARIPTSGCPGHVSRRAGGI
jgi:hypothetical protein